MMFITTAGLHNLKGLHASIVSFQVIVKLGSFGFNAIPDPDTDLAFHTDADPDPDPAAKINADHPPPAPTKYASFQNVDRGNILSNFCVTGTNRFRPKLNGHPGKYAYMTSVMTTGLLLRPSILPCTASPASRSFTTAYDALTSLFFCVLLSET